MSDAAGSPGRLRSGARHERALWIAPYLAPAVVGIVALVAWEAAVRWSGVPDYLLPAPSAIARAMVDQRAALLSAWGVTLTTMLLALGAAVVGGVVMAVAFTASRALELSLFPYAVILQVTPLVAVAPLLLIWVQTPWAVMLLCAWIVAFFPILSNTAVGLRSSDPRLEDLFRLYGASRWQRVRLLLAPTALPYFLAGLRVSVNLSLVGAVVAEFVTAATTLRPGLASIIYEAQYRTDMDRVFAALAMISLTGIGFYFATHALSHALLGRWRGEQV